MVFGMPLYHIGKNARGFFEVGLFKRQNAYEWAEDENLGKNDKAPRCSAERTEKAKGDNGLTLDVSVTHSRWRTEKPEHPAKEDT